MANPAIEGVRAAMRVLAQQVEVLPAVGGALQEEEHPDADEQVELILGREEKLFEANWETNATQLYRPLQPLTREQRHLFRYFQDGSYRNYFLGNLLEHDRETPVLFAQIGACQLYRNDDGSVKPIAERVKPYLFLALDRVSESVRNALIITAQANGVEVVDLQEEDELGQRNPLDLRLHAQNKVRFKMHEQEVALALEQLNALEKDTWLVVDGSLQFRPLLSSFSDDSPIPRLIGVAKNFRKDPLFTIGKGVRQQRFTLHRLLSGLDTWHRTAVFGARGGKVVFWYLRLRPQGQLDYPLMGVIKVELVNPSKQCVDTALIDSLSQALLAERNATPHGVDRRWHAHLYPIYLAERYVQNRLMTREVIRQALRWR
ncbi:MAG: hypothetical protein N2045_13580 [Fimbriimonadales bacterium]|nr:hypothetical protein [Fimbriimonadales bacterium]